MEALILIFGELVFAILAPFVALIVELIGAVLSLIFSGGLGRESVRAGASRIARAIGIVLLGLAMLALVAIWVVNSFYFDSSVRYVFSKVEQRSSIATSCRDIDGSLFAGRVELRDCSMQRPTHSSSSFDLTVQRVSLDLRVTSLLGTALIDTAEVVGLNGWVRREPQGSDRERSAERTERPRRSFEIAELKVSDVNVELSGVNQDGNPFLLPVEIQGIESRPLRSRLALFDVLFRSNVSGSIAGAPFKVSTAEIEDGRRTAWRAERVPVASLGAVTGGALSWFSEGYVDVFVDDEWQRGDSLRIDMDWRLELSDVEVAAPEGTGSFARMASEPLTRFVNGLDGNFPLEFGLVINEDQFEHRLSLAAAGLWSAVGEAVNKVLGAFGVNLEEAANTADTLKEGAKSVLDRLRKPKEDDPD